MANFRVLFIYPNQRTESLVPPSLAIFSRILKDRGYTVDLFDTTNYDLDADDYIQTKFTKERNDSKGYVQSLLVRPFESRAELHRKHTRAVDGLRKKVEEFKPDLIAVTSTESTFLLAINLLKAIKEYQIPNIVGGVFPTFAPHRALSFPEVDMICVGEGDNLLVELCERMSKGQDYSKVTSLWLKKKNGDIVKNTMTDPVNVDEVPDPDFELFEEIQLYRPMYGKVYKMIPVETMRGCPYTCTFCNSPAQNYLYKERTGKNFFRKRSLERVHNELVYYRDVMKAEYIYFWADTFFAWSEKEFDAFCEMYSDIKLPFWCQTRVETVTEDKLRKIKDIGLHFLGFGMEHGNEKFRAEVVSRKYSNETAIEALKIPKLFDVPFSMNNIIGFPDETRELSDDTIEIKRNIQPTQMSCSILQPYYGTPIRPLCEAKGYLHPDILCPANSENTVMNLPTYTPDQLIGLKRTFAMYVRFPKSRWPEIRIAEQLTPEGDAMCRKLGEEFTATFFSTPKTDITEQGNPIPVDVQKRLAADDTLPLNN